MSHRIIFIAFATASLAACASSAARPTELASGCGFRPQDSVFVTGRLVYRECQVDEKARSLPTRIHADFTPPQSRTPSSSCYSAEMDFVVDTLGVAEMNTLRMGRVSDASYGESVKAIVPLLRWEPAKKDGRPVRQIVNYKSLMGVQVTVTRVGAASPPSTGSNRPPRC